MLVGLEGNTSTGKTTFMFTAPWPLVGFSFDSGVKRALYGSKHELFSGIDIEVIQYPPPPLTDIKALVSHWLRNEGRAITVYLLPQPLQFSTKLEGTVKLWNEFTKLANIAIQERLIGSVVFDTMTIARRVAADCYLETLQATPGGAGRVQLLQVEWGKPGDYIRTIYTTCQNQSEYYAAEGIPKHFLFSHHLTERRVNEKVVTNQDGSPVLDMEGLHNTYRFLDIAMRFDKGVVEVANPDVFASQKTVKEMAILAEFKKNGYNIGLEGTKMVNPTWDSMATLLNKNLGPEMQINLRGE